MFLTLDETAVSPSGLQLFIHVMPELLIRSLDGRWSGDAQAKLFLSLGFINIEERTVLETDPFVLNSLPEFERFHSMRSRQEMLSLPYWDYPTAFLAFFHHVGPGIGVLFHIDEGKMTRFTVRLGVTDLGGDIQAAVDISQYFGESSQLVDAN